MITGITVLNTYDTRAMPMFAAIVLMICGLGIIALSIELLNDGEGIGAVVSLILGIIFLTIGFIGIIAPDVSHNVDALIDPQTPFIDVYENYEIKDKRGEIYHLILKQESEAAKDE